MKSTLTTTCALVALLAVAMVGCDQSPAPEPKAAGDAIPANLLLASAPDKPQDVKAMKAAAKQGDNVVVRGVIGGRVEPMASNRAILTIIDPAIETCDKMGGDDHCKSPWDACCVDQETITAAAATVQVVDGKGQPLKVGLNGHKGLKPLSEVVVVGKVHSADANNLVIDATGIYVKG